MLDQSIMNCIKIWKFIHTNGSYRHYRVLICARSHIFKTHAYRDYHYKMSRALCMKLDPSSSKCFIASLLPLCCRRIVFLLTNTRINAIILPSDSIKAMHHVTFLLHTRAGHYYLTSIEPFCLTIESLFSEYF
jgi:hypothetical protein